MGYKGIPLEESDATRSNAASGIVESEEGVVECVCVKTVNKED